MKSYLQEPEAQRLPDATEATINRSHYYRQFLHGYYQFDCVVEKDVTRSTKFYIPEGSIYNQPTIFLGVPGGKNSWDFLVESGWKALADEYGLYLVLMEASDITGELKLSMQIIATMDQELQRTGHCYLRKENRFRELITLFTRLNAVIRAYMSGQVTEEDRRFLIEQSVSETAVKVGVFILPISAEQKEELETEILKDLNA